MNDREVVGETNRLETDRRGVLLVTLASLTVLLLAWWQAVDWYQMRLRNEQIARAEVETALRGNALSAAVNRRMALLDGLVAYVQMDALEENFEQNFAAFSSEMYASAEGIRNIAVAPGGAVQHIYPRDGNEAVLGYQPALDARQEVRDSVERAITSREIVLSGPNELIQGGMGVIARKAIFVEGEYWGLANVVIDLPPILERARLNTLEGELDFSLRDSDGNVFYGEPALFGQAPVLQRISLPEGYWEMAGAPPEGWEAAIQPDVLLFQGVGLGLVFLLTTLVTLTFNRQKRLAQAVALRTRQVSQINRELQEDIAERMRLLEVLSEREAQYRSVFESSSEGLFINDLSGRLVDFNPAAARMHGYTPAEFRTLQPSQFIHASSLPLFWEYIEAVKSGKRFRCRAVDVHKDGTLFYVEMRGTGFTYRGVPHALAVVRDVTEQVRSYQLLEQRVEERTRELSTLLRISHNVASTLELNPLLGLIIDQLKHVVDYTGASVLTLDGDTLSVRAYRGPAPADHVKHVQFSLSAALLERDGQVLREPVILSDVLADDPVAERFRTNVGERMQTTFSYVRCWMGVPLIVKDRVIGMLTFDHSQPHFYQPQHAQLALAFANQAAVAIENARLYERAQELASLQERQNLARELHDSVSQALYGIALGARTAQSILKSADGERIPVGRLQEPIDYVLLLADAGLAEMRSLIFELRPESLKTEGLIAAMDKQIAAVRARHQLEVEGAFCREPAISLDAKHALYRVVQEALHNTVKHALATRVQVTLREEPDAVRLEVADDGIGFDPDREFPGHLGLQSMQERAERLGGTLQVTSAPGQGTRVVACLPLGGNGSQPQPASMPVLSGETTRRDPAADQQTPSQALTN